ncbi:hypothetical protein A2U01_0094806, partial [Trifolium medium]|nr:hypothetical protein [Trifolium medium]
KVVVHRKNDSDHHEPDDAHRADRSFPVYVHRVSVAVPHVAEKRLVDRELMLQACEAH